jgi:hypothetical protein
MLDMRVSSLKKSPRPDATMLILGNGHRYQLDNGTPEITVTFNRLGHVAETTKQVDVRMTRDADGKHRLTASSPGNHAGLADLDHGLNQMLDQQALALGCLPSSGYALIHGLWNSHERVSVDGIWFNPSLARPTHLAPRKPLPQAFHNWLGERRTTFQRWLTKPPMKWSWPMIDGVDTESPSACAVPPQGSVHHSQLMEVMVESARSRSMRELEDMAHARVEPSPDLLHASPEVTRLEQMFYLSRTQSDTPNWWLFDAEASAMIEQIAQRLRHAQYLAFSQAALMQGMAE